jgi:hypothetical protein
VSSKERNRQKRAEWEAESWKREEERIAEANRRRSMSTYSRIEEFVADDELKTILHAICERIGLED